MLFLYPGTAKLLVQFGAGLSDDVLAGLVVPGSGRLLRQGFQNHHFHGSGYGFSY